MTRPRHAFTLTELLVSLAIVGLLAGLLLPAVHKTRDSARRLQVRCDFARFEDAYNVHKANGGKRLVGWGAFPLDLPRRDPWGGFYHLAVVLQTYELLPDEKGIPRPYQTTHPYRKATPRNHFLVGGVPPRHVAFQLVSPGPDRRLPPFGEWPGGSDDVANFEK